MGKGLDKFLNMIRSTDDDYEDVEYDEEYDEEYDDYYDDEEEAEEVKPKKSSSRTSSRVTEESSSYTESRPQSSVASASVTRSSRSKIVPMKQPSGGRSFGMEVSIQKPSSFEESGDICDVLLTGKAAIVNLEGLDVAVAQRIIDFISGACYAMSGNIEKVSNYIFIVTPAGIDISGDMENAAQSSSGVDMSAFRMNVN